jgi:hypothetical protein
MQQLDNVLQTSFGIFELVSEIARNIETKQDLFHFICVNHLFCTAGIPPLWHLQTSLTPILQILLWGKVLN